MSTPPISDIDHLLAENAALRARIADLEQQCASRPAAATGLDQTANTARTTAPDLPIADLLEQLFTHAPLALQIYDRNGTSLRMNEANRRMLGVPDVSYAVGEYNVLTDPWSVASGYALYYARAYVGEVVHLPEVRVDFGDPTNTWQTERRTLVLDNLVFPIHDATGQVVAVVSCILDLTARVEAEDEVRRLNADLERLVAERTAQLTETIARLETEITARRQTEAALRESETRLRQIAEHLDVVVWLEDAATSKILYINPAYESLFGRSRTEVYADPMSVFDAIHPDDREQMRQMLFQQPARDFSVEYRIVRPDGTIRWIWVDNALFRDASGTIVRRVGSAKDITERKQAEEERLLLERSLLELQRHKSLYAMAGGIAHDFNNLLAVIIGNVDLIEEDLPPDSPVQGSLTPIRQAARRAADLTRQMLAYSGKGHFVVEQCDLCRVVQQTAELLHAMIPRTTTLRCVLEGAAPIEADVQQIRQLLLNLVSNAAEAIGDAPGAITVTVEARSIDRDDLMRTYLTPNLPAGAYAALEIADTGRGMDTATQAQIFEPFYTTKFIGRGLGLPSVLGMVRGHRGAIRVESAPGRGTTITVLLPLAGQPHVEPAGANRHLDGRAASQAAQLRGTVLVVDDEDHVREVVARMLERAGLTVLTARDGLAGVELFAAQCDRIDVVLLDLTMPYISGQEVGRTMLRLRPNLPVILMSGYSEAEAKRQFAGLDLRGFLQKPFPNDELIAILQRILT